MKIYDLTETKSLEHEDMASIKGGFGILTLLSGFDFGPLINTDDFDEPLGDDLYEGDGSGPSGGFGSDNGPIGDGKK